MKYLFSIFFSFLLVGCATTYQSESFSGGFSSTQLDENVFQVTFKGNAFISPEKANDYALLRSAEIALEKGYKFFVISETQKYSIESTYTTPTTATTNLNSNSYGSAYHYGNNFNYSGNTYGTATTTFSGGQTYNISKPRATNIIICFKDKPQGFAYNAEFIINSLKAKYSIDTPSK